MMTVFPIIASNNVNEMDVVSLPQWLDDLIYKKIGARFDSQHKSHISCVNMDVDQLVMYLGTYFPRSFAETFSLSSNIFAQPKYQKMLQHKEVFNILDICAGTGGDLLGLLYAIKSYLPKCQTVNIIAVDGNANGLNILQYLLQEGSSEFPFEINIICQNELLQKMDLATIAGKTFDFILCSKALCELIEYDGISCAYEAVAGIFMPFLADTGLFFLIDIASRSSKLEKYYPQIMNSQINCWQSKHSEYVTLLPIPCAKGCNNGYCYGQKKTRVLFNNSRMSVDSNIFYRVLCASALQQELVGEVKDAQYLIGPKQVCSKNLSSRVVYDGLVMP